MNYQPDAVDISEPPLGSVVTVGVGESMVRQGRYVEHEAIRVTQAYESLAYDVMPGVYIKKEHPLMGKVSTPHLTGLVAGW